MRAYPNSNVFREELRTNNVLRRREGLRLPLAIMS
jgi:hypothetical protein